MPSALRSPMRATEQPNSTSNSSCGPFPDSSLTFVKAPTAPVPLRNSTYTAPASLPPSSSSCAPTARASVPLPAKSPRDATAHPKKSPLLSGGPPPRTALILVNCVATPAAASRWSRYTAPPPLTPSSSRSAPTARFQLAPWAAPVRPSRPATALPNSSPSSSGGPPPAVWLMTSKATTTPVLLRRSTCTAPASGSPSSSWYAPTARSSWPSPPRVSTHATERPKRSPLSSGGPPPLRRLMVV
mmetsp:Transcript_8600/g.29307  ORF Transcript_8600/g.29307 Transcript_8600/m.29307 type:complete len:243 (+) Transcript_8600:958-1686(+)